MIYYHKLEGKFVYEIEAEVYFAMKDLKFEALKEMIKEKEEQESLWGPLLTWRGGCQALKQDQSQSEMLGHRDFVDVKMDLYIKHRAQQWALLDTLDVDRQFLIR